MKITKDLLAPSGVVVESGPHTFVAEASDLGMRPGEWPITIQTDLGNGLDFVIVDSTKDRDGGVLSVFYRQSGGCTTLKIFHD
jgi:hypothetical protein